MSKKWKPGFGDAYYYVDNACSVDIERYDGHTWDDERIAAGNCFNTKDDAHAAAEKVKALLLSLHSEPVTDCNQSAQPTTNSSQLLKLTAEVFDRPDCPKWAKYAALSGAGCLIFYEDKPRMSKDEYPKRWINYDRWYPVEGTKFDASDWQNSLVERPKNHVNWDEVEEILCNSTLTFKEKKQELPDWCKVGAIGFEDEYFKIIKINDKSCDVQYLDPHMQDEDGNIGGITFDCLRQCHEARLRPYNAEEMKALVGKVIKLQDYAFLIIAYSAVTQTVSFNNYKYTASDLLNDNLIIDGSPCGVLEHLKNGEWVR